MAELDRDAVDRIARAVVSGRRGLGARADALADRAAAMMRRLAAMGAPGSVRAAAMNVRRGPLASEPDVVREAPGDGERCRRSLPPTSRVFGDRAIAAFHRSAGITRPR